ncbi:MAG: ribonuclease E/G [Desulfuromonadaceae bacterium]|nr:ribonuclease E/G [Desulfuromonadaceae bacterium]
MSKKMLINATLPEEDRVAIVEDGQLTELDIEVLGCEQTKGNIYKGEVIRVEPGLQAAFIEYGAQRPGFLQIGDIHPSLWPAATEEEMEDHPDETEEETLPSDEELETTSDEKTEEKKQARPRRRRPPITEILKRGQKLLVQVVKEERGNKGAALTTELSLAGRYMVLMADSSSRGISRKIEHEPTRRNIKKALEQLKLPDNMGYIIRTAAIDQPPEELKRDFDYLLGIYNSVLEHAKTAKAPALIYQESSLVLRCIRDYFTPDIDEVLIDDRDVYQQARDFFMAVMPDYVNLVKLHQERRPIFSRYQIEEQIAQLSSNTVNLPSGGSIVLDQTEALVAIDVNSGKMSGEQDVEATAFRVNHEAAVEIARQLRLRDMGGLVVIDFIDMRQRKNAREVEKALKQALKSDKARVTIGHVSSQFGLLEMSRQRIKPNLDAASSRPCPHCQGTGRIRSEEARALSLLRRIQAGTAKGQIEQVVGTVAVDVATYLLNNKRRELHDIEQRYQLRILIRPDINYLPDQSEIEFIRATKETREEQNGRKALVDVNLVERAKALPAPAAEEVVVVAELPPEKTDPATEAVEGTSENPPTKSRSRRSRRSRRKSSAGLSLPAPEAADNQNETSAGESGISPPPVTPVTAGTAPESPQQTTSSQALKSEASAEIDNEVAKDTPEKLTARRPPRRRKPAAKKAATATKTEDAVQTAEEAVTAPLTTSTPATPPSGEPSENGEAKRPRRRTRRTAKTKTEADSTSEGPATTGETPGEAEEEKPKRRTTRRTRTKTEESSEDIEKAPRRRTRSTAAAANDEVASVTEEPGTAEKTKRRAPRRPSRLKPADKAEE